MIGDASLTLTGNLTAAPKSGVSRNGDTWAKIRVASTSRVFDRGQNQWRDGEKVFLDVSCWRKLADHVVATLDRGDAVVVIGRLRQRPWDDAQGVRHTATELEAETIGADLTRCSARLARTPRIAPVEDYEPSGDAESAGGGMNAFADSPAQESAA